MPIEPGFRFPVNIFSDHEGLPITHGIFTGAQSGLLIRMNYGKRFIVRADESLTAFEEL